MSSQKSQKYPPLLGDEKGKYRVHILGNSGSGKSTTAAAVAEILGVPFISLDRLHWEPGWVSTPSDALRKKVEDAIAQTDGSWVVEGDYVQRVGPTAVFDASTDAIWLDPPLLLYFPRIVLRTFRRLVGWEPPCSDGCPERLSEVFLSKESILWWCLSQHWPVRKRNQGRMQQVGLGVGSEVANQRMRRLGGWGKERDDWLENVRTMIDAKKNV